MVTGWGSVIPYPVTRSCRALWSLSDRAVLDAASAATRGLLGLGFPDLRGSRRCPILAGMSFAYLPETRTRDQVDALPGITVLQFGTDWCGYCRAAEPAIASVLSEADGVRHVLVEDGKGRPLGRSFRVKLWPTLVFLADGAEIARVVRPWGTGELVEALARVRAAAEAA